MPPSHMARRHQWANYHPRAVGAHPRTSMSNSSSPACTTLKPGDPGVRTGTADYFKAHNMSIPGDCQALGRHIVEETSARLAHVVSKTQSPGANSSWQNRYVTTTAPPPVVTPLHAFCGTTSKSPGATPRQAIPLTRDVGEAVDQISHADASLLQA